MATPNRVVPTWDIADRLRKIRRGVLGIEQAEMSDALGVGRQGYAAWEAGRTQPRDVVALARRIELLAGVPAAWTLGVLDAETPALSVPVASASGSPETAAGSAVLGKGINPH